MKKKDTIENAFANDTKKYVGIMEEAISKDDFKTYYAAKAKLDESVENYKRNKRLENEVNTTNFFQLNHIFENELPSLFVNDQASVAKVIKLIKEDKNLSSQFSFLNGIRNYCKKGSNAIDSGEMLHMLESLVAEKLDKNSVQRSNTKLRNLMMECSVIPEDFISDDKKKLYEAFDIVLTRKPNSDNLLTIAESREKIKNYLTENKAASSNDDFDADKVMSEFEKRMNEELTASEANMVKEIIESSPNNKEQMFDKFKNECVSKIDTMLESNEGNEELIELKKTINERKFNEATLAEEIAKLLEIRSILNED